jgi:N-acetyl-gamma-glutamyl-phosphate reductase
VSNIKAGVIGATGYAGAELVRLLASHPSVTVTAVSSVSFEGQRISEIYPNLSGICDLILTGADEVIASCDVVFASLPHGLSEEIAVKCDHTVLIDLGADFRLSDESVYKTWYGKNFLHPGLHPGAVYCIPELHRSEIKSASVIANPGCYPTSAVLALAPALTGGLIETDGIIIDAKSGVTGAGRALTQNTHFPDTNEAFSAYKAGSHRHMPEIEQTLTRLSGTSVKVTFTPHLLPVNRGIETTVYARLKEGTALESVREAYVNAYKNERFVRVMPEGVYANIKNVRMSNYCDISLHSDPHTGMLILCSCIDNMVKGAAGQAIQNMNIRFGFDEAAGLCAAPPAF